LVIIGQHLDEAALRAALDACLLTDAELGAGPADWAKLEDPWPAWPTPEEARAASEDDAAQAPPAHAPSPSHQHVHPH